MFKKAGNCKLSNKFLPFFYFLFSKNLLLLLLLLLLSTLENLNNKLPTEVGKAFGLADHIEIPGNKMYANILGFLCVETIR